METVYIKRMILQRVNKTPISTSELTGALKTLGFEDKAIETAMWELARDNQIELTVDRLISGRVGG